MKKFDCVEMKRQVQKQIREETRNLSREEELNYFHQAAEQFWKDIRALRKERASAAQGRVE